MADNPGDWALHCHKVHHTMNQMGHGLPVLIGVDQSAAAERIERVVPGFMTMGSTGMGDMMHMGTPRNSLLMGAHEGLGRGPFGSIFMGGMFTILKIREGLASYDQDPGWYQHPRGTVALKASAAELVRDGIDVNAPTARAVDSPPTASAPRTGSRGHPSQTPTPQRSHR